VVLAIIFLILKISQLLNLIEGAHIIR
jgi:hypothetical protein